MLSLPCQELRREDRIAELAVIDDGVVACGFWRDVWRFHGVFGVGVGWGLCDYTKGQ